MLTRLLKLFLYLILFSCATWGSVLVGAPSLLNFIVKKNFGDSVRLYNLRITPSFNLLVSRIEFANAKFDGFDINGSVRAVATDLSGILRLEPVLDIAIGPAQLSNFGKISKAEISLNFFDRSVLSKANVRLELNQVTTNTSFGAEFISLQGMVDFRNEVITDTKISVHKFESLNGLQLKSSNFQGSISNWHYLNKDLIFPKNVFFESPEVSLLNEKIYFSNVSLKVDLYDSTLDLKITSDQFKDNNNDYLANAFVANLILDSYKPNNIEKLGLYVGKLNLPGSPFWGQSEVADLSINIFKNSDLNYDLSGNGKLKDVEFQVNDFPIAKLADANFMIASKYRSSEDVNAELITELALETNDNSYISLDAVAKLDITENELVKCLEPTCSFSNFSLSYDLFAEKYALSGSLNCGKFPCASNAVEHKLQTKNTASFFDKASNSRIFNPVFLAFVYRNLLSGQKIGEGHSFSF